jgi:chromosome segregation ATPase
MTHEEQLAMASEALATNEAKVAELETAILAMSEKLEATEKAMSAKAEEVVKITAELEKVKADTIAIQNEKATASEKAAKIVASIGVKPANVTSAPTAVTKPTKDDLWTKYKALSDPKERNAFYRTNRADMI